MYRQIIPAQVEFCPELWRPHTFGEIISIHTALFRSDKEGQEANVSWICHCENVLATLWNGKSGGQTRQIQPDTFKKKNKTKFLVSFQACELQKKKKY